MLNYALVQTAMIGQRARRAGVRVRRIDGLMMTSLSFILLFVALPSILLA